MDRHNLETEAGRRRLFYGWSLETHRTQEQTLALITFFQSGAVETLFELNPRDRAKIQAERKRQALE